MTRIHMPSIKRVLNLGPFSDREVAEQLEVAESTVSRWRRGESKPGKAYVDALYDLHLQYARAFMDEVKEMGIQIAYRDGAEGIKVDLREIGGYREAS